MTKKKAVVVLSGGMDSVTSLAIAKDNNFDCYNLTFDYGQKSISEIISATYYSDKFDSKEHKIFNINFNDFTNSSLIDKNIDIPVNKNDVIPTTYVPMRNIIFLSIACSWAEKVGASDIFIGANAIDYSGYPDCRDIFLEAYEKMINLGSKTGSEGGQFNIHRPLIDMKKTEIITIGKSLGLNYRKTISCYQATSDGKACGVCESCLFRKNAFLELGLEDETIYV